MEATTDDSLNDRQQRFVFEYLIDLNASAAAERAGYSARSRASQASVLMNDPAVRERIRIEMQSLLADLRLTALDLMKERMRAGFFRAGKLFDPSGRLLGFEEMETEVRDALVIGGKWRKGEPEVRFRTPNREPALRALERVHERLDKLNEAHYAALEKERMRAQPQTQMQPTPGRDSVPPPMWPALKLEEQAPVEQDGGPIEPPEGDGGPIQPPMPEAEKAAPPDNFVEKTHVLSGPATTTEVMADVPTTTVVEAPATVVEPPVAAVEPAATGIEAPAMVAAPALDPAGPSSPLNPGAPLIKRHDADLMWGGKREPTPPPEPSPALLEHLARVRHEEMAEEMRRDLQARGGRIRPGPQRPQGLPPGYNPPWLRDDRPQFAIGAGEFSFDD